MAIVTRKSVEVAKPRVEMNSEDCTGYLALMIESARKILQLGVLKGALVKDCPYRIEIEFDGNGFDVGKVKLESIDSRKPNVYTYLVEDFMAKYQEDYIRYFGPGDFEDITEDDIAEFNKVQEWAYEDQLPPNSAQHVQLPMFRDEAKE